MIYGISFVLTNDTELNLNREYKANTPDEVIGYFYNQIFDNRLKVYTAVSGDGVVNMIPKESIMYIKVYEIKRPTNEYTQSEMSEGNNIPYIPEVPQYTQNDIYGEEELYPQSFIYSPEPSEEDEKNDV